MTLKISTDSAKILATLVLNDVREYAAAHPEAYAAFLDEQEQNPVTQEKRRRSKKANPQAGAVLAND